MDRLDAFIRQDAQLSQRQLIVIRVIWGLVGLQIAGTLATQFAHARDGGYFNLPLFDWWPLLPGLMHRIVLYSTYLFAVLILIGVRPQIGGWGIATVLAYVLVSDHFAFRHVWVLLANIYAWVGLMLTETSAIAPLGKMSRPTTRQYALFGVRTFVALTYIIAAFPKMNAEFLSGSVIRFLATSSWGSDSVIVQTLTSAPWICPLLAWSSCLLEIYFGIALLIPRQRSTVFVMGFLFHTAVPLVAGVGHSLNIYFAAAYLFFAWPPDQRPFLPKKQRSGWLIRADRLERIDWEPASPSTSGQQSNWRVFLSQTLYGSPFVWWYGMAWCALVALKTRTSLAFLPALVAAVVVVGREVRWLLSSGNQQPMSPDMGSKGTG